MLREDKFNLEHTNQFNRYFNEEAIQKTIQEHVKKAGLKDFEGVCSTYIKKGLYDKLEQTLEALISVSRSRQAWKGLHPSGQPLTV